MTERKARLIFFGITVLLCAVGITFQFIVLGP